MPEPHRLVIKGSGEARHDGARKGVVGKLDEVADAVRVAAEEAEAMASVPVELAVVGLGGLPIQGLPAMASVPVTGRNLTVSEDDLRRALASCAQVSIPPDYRVLDIIACGYALDGQPGMEYPVGMPGTRLDASAFVVYTNKTHAETVEQTVNRAAVAVKQLVYEPLAAAAAVVTPDERELGCLLLDLGYATTEWVLFAEGVVVSSGAIPVGGRHFTADLAALLLGEAVNHDVCRDHCPGEQQECQQCNRQGAAGPGKQGTWLAHSVVSPGREAIALAPDGLDEHRCGRVRFDLAAQVFDV